MKADLVVLDILSTTNWTRPIYFAITTGSDVYLNMMDYFQLEGLTYRIVPIKNTDPVEGGTYGHINTDILYTNLVEKFKWGNMDKEGVYLDETTLRQTRNFRNLFYRLAMKLVAEGDNTRAIKAIDRCIEVMPKNTVPYDIFIIRLSEAYYAAGAPEKANTLINGMVDQAIEKYQYYSRFKGSKAKGVSTELEENTNILMYAQQVAQFNKQDALLKDIQAKSQKVLGAQMPPMQ
jgi:tetratricopeptide (TPR) repeat protein